MGTNKHFPNMDSFQTQRPGRGLHLPKTTQNSKDENEVVASEKEIDSYDIPHQMQKYYTDLEGRIRRKIKSLSENIFVDDLSLSEAKKSLMDLNNAYNNISDLIDEMKNSTDAEDVTMKIINIFTRMDINVPKESTKQMVKQRRHFKVSNTGRDVELNRRPWEEVFKRALTHLNESRKSIQGEIREEAKKINFRIESNLYEIADAIKDHYNREIRKLPDIQQLRDKLATECDVITKMIREIGKVTTASELVKTIHDCANMLDITVPKENMLDITNQSRYLEFMKNASKGDLTIEPTAWANPFEAVSRSLQQTQKWYTFLYALYDKFSEYEIQKNKQMYNVAKLDDWGKTDMPQGLTITAASYPEFSNKISTFNITEQDSMKNITLTDLQLEELNHVINLTLKHKPNANCEDSMFIIRGSYIPSGESTGLPDNCLKFKATENTKFCVFVSNALYVDSNEFIAGVTIAPKWEIKGEVTVNFSGSKGESRETPWSFFEPRYRCKAANGTHPGAGGADGRPGGPGGPGGSFFGIADRIVNGKNLTMKVNGGDGGSGEHGGDGYSKNKGLSADVLPPSSERCQKNCKPVYGFKCQTLSYDFKPGQCSGSGKLKNCTSDEYSCKYKFFGRSGSGEKWKCDGGNGGRGGKGGPPGKILLFELSEDSGVVKFADRGKEGENGLGGYPGCVECNGDDRIVSFDSKVSSEWKLEEIIKHGGKKGVDGGNTAGLLDPKPPFIMKDTAKVVNKYKGFLIENMVDRFTRARHFQFLEKINRNDKIKSLYDTMGFIDEFEGLEKQFHALNKEVNFIPFYQSLLPRISEYSKSPKGDEKSSQHKKVLNYLYTSILGRISDLKDDSDSNLIINISSYLDIVKREVEALKDLQKVNNKAEIISKYQERYKDNLDKKIEEAKSIVEKMITPEMDNISKDMDSKIDSLIDETIELQRKVEKDKEALIKKKEELETAMALRGLFSCLSILGQIVSFCGPVGAVVGTVIGATSSVAESLVLDNQQDVQISPDIVPNLKILGGQIKSVREKKVKYLSKLLEEITQEIGKNPKKLGDMSEKIADLKSRLNKAKENTNGFKEIKTLESELKQEIKNKEGQLKIEEVVPDDKTKGALKAVERMTQAVQLGSLLVDIYNKHKSDQAKIDAISDAIEKTDEKIQKLKLYEEQIYEVITPTLHSMENNLQDVASKLEGKSQASLEVTKWKVQSALKDMKLQMQQLTEGFQVKGSLARCIEKLEEVMTTLINVYDRVQNYQDQQNLANYIADISSASASNININNPNLVKPVNHLEMLIRSNVVLTQYKAAVNAFKQWVFPFASYYLKQSMLPSQLQLEKNIENLVDGAVKQIDSIKSKLDLYKTSVKKTDKYINTGEFSSRYVSTEPFYVWKNDEYRDAISKLLSGQEVVLRSDVKGSALDKDAIKFSVIELHFKTNNETLQSEISNVIKGFDVMATHLGNSYYRYADKIYVITSDSQTILYSCEKNTAGEPVRKNMVFDKIKEGDLMLSPYTMWELKMINSTRKITFRDLEIYKDYVDIELSGFGSYVLNDVNGFKLAEKEYRSVGKFDEVDICVQSEARNSSECSDLIGRMVRSAHHVQGYDGYATNGASPSLWSPINYACNFLKMHVVSNFVQFLIDEVEFINVNVNGDLASKPSSNLGSTEKRLGSNNAGGSVLVGNKLIKENEIGKHNCMVRDLNFNDCKSFLPNAPMEENSCFNFSDCLEVNSTLLLADVVTRKITENRYKQPNEECLLSPKEKLQIRLENCAIRSDDDAKRHLYILSRMTDVSENSWLSGAKNFAKSIFQYFGLDKNSEPEEFVEDVRTLFA